MTNKEAYKIIGERAAELVKRPEIKKKMLKIAAKQGKKEAEKFLYLAAIATLMGET